MKTKIVALMVAFLLGACATQAIQSQLTDEEQMLVQAVMALQKPASDACNALPLVKEYRALLDKTNAHFAKSKKTIDWRTGQLTAPAAVKDDPKDPKD